MNSTSIVVGQRGWVWVGKIERSPLEVTLHGARCVRVWGATRGLAQIANEGPTSSTVLDDACTIKFHPLSIVAEYVCNADSWAEYLTK